MAGAGKIPSRQEKKPAKSNEAKLNAKICRILSQEHVPDYEMIRDEYSDTIPRFDSFDHGKFGTHSTLASSVIQHTPPSSRTPSPEQRRVFRFETCVSPTPATPPPNPGYHLPESTSGYPVTKSFSPLIQRTRTKAISPISPPSCPGISASGYISQMPSTRSRSLTPITPPPAISGTDCLSPITPSRGSLLVSPTSPSLESVMPTLFPDRRWGPGQLSGLAQEKVDVEQKSIIRSESGSTDPTFTWSGQLPPRVYKNPIYSIKIFLGGVPWDITEAGLQQAFRQFGTVKVEWPGKEGKQNRHPPKGYVYLLFDNERSVKSLLSNCTHDFSNGGDWYYKISSRRMRSKEVQVIPWVLSDSNYAKNVTQKLDSTKTVFVGGLHGMINAESLAMLMNDLFDGVIYAGIDTDKHKYPIGSGRVTFNNAQSFVKAVQAAFIEIRTPKFTKKVQIDPYLEDSMCHTCSINPGPFFCRDPECFRYFCRSCWNWHHSIEELKQHRPMSRHSKSTTSVY